MYAKERTFPCFQRSQIQFLKSTDETLPITAPFPRDPNQTLANMAAVCSFKPSPSATPVGARLLRTRRPPSAAPPPPGQRPRPGVATSPLFSRRVLTQRTVSSILFSEPIAAIRCQLRLLRCRGTSFVAFGLNSLARTVRRRRKRARCRGLFCVPRERLVMPP